MSATATATSTSSTAATPSVDDLYKFYGILADAKEDAPKHEATYLQIVSGTKGGVKEKQLAAQFIARFFKHFSKHSDVAIDAIFDLCEDEDITIRKSAIKDLSVLCKDCGPEHLTRIADILTQLLQTNDQQESTQVQATLITVLKQNPKETLNAIFNQINTAELEEIRKRAIKFLVAKLPVMIEPNSSSSSGIINKDVEELLVKHIKQVLTDVDAEEFSLFIRLLTALPSMSSLTGRQELVNVIMGQSELDKPYGANDAERIMILLACVQQAIPLFSKNVQSNKFVKGFLDNVIPIFTKLQDETVKFEVLKAFAELCSHYNTANAATNALITLGGLFDVLTVYLPKPSEVEETENQDQAKFNFSFVECLLFSFHALARINGDFLAAGDEATKERLKDFRLRLQYFAKGTQNYIKELRSTLAKPATVPTGTNKEENDENKIRRVALRVTTNIDLLIKDFFHNPPSYKVVTTLSWKAATSIGHDQAAAAASAAKRTLSASANDNTASDGGNKKKTTERGGVYAPPSGRYSANHANFSSPSANGQQHGNGHGKRRTYSNGANQSSSSSSYRRY